MRSLSIAVLLGVFLYSQVSNATELRRFQQFSELMSGLPKLHDYGAKAMNVARFWSDFDVGLWPGATVGVVSLGLFIICITIVVYTIAVTPVAGFIGRQDKLVDNIFDAYPQVPDALDTFNGFEAPYAQRMKRSMDRLSQSVMDAIDKLDHSQNEFL